MVKELFFKLQSRTLIKAPGGYNFLGPAEGIPEGVPDFYGK